MSNPSVSIRPALAEKQSLAARFSQMVAAFERSRTAKADRVIRRFSRLGARISEDKQQAEANKRVAAAPFCSLIVGIPQ